MLQFSIRDWQRDRKIAWSLGELEDRKEVQMARGGRVLCDREVQTDTLGRDWQVAVGDQRKDSKKDRQRCSAAGLRNWA